MLHIDYIVSTRTYAYADDTMVSTSRSIFEPASDYHSLQDELPSIYPWADNVSTQPGLTTVPHLYQPTILYSGTKGFSFPADD